MGALEEVKESCYHEMRVSRGKIEIYTRDLLWKMRVQEAGRLRTREDNLD
jgi:hypothetical protein